MLIHMYSHIHMSTFFLLSTYAQFFVFLFPFLPAKKRGDTEIAERGRSVLVMRARYRSTGLTPHQRGWTDAG